MKIAICITTRNRLKTFVKGWNYQFRFAPPDSRIFIVDDASDYRPAYYDLPENAEGYGFDEQVGIARAKNKCLEMAYNWGADHIFLFDNDCFPIVQDWWKPYVEHKEPHLMYQFKLPGKPSNDMQELYRDDQTVAYTHTRGAMLYVERRVLDIVGGMDTRYGEAMYEHTDWTNRIHNAGLTTYRAMDVPNSHKLLYCFDEDGSIESSIPVHIKRRNMNRNRGLYQKSKTSKEYKEFR